jgi:hypothetical protein
MSEIKLLQCPFCGQNAAVWRGSRWDIGPNYLDKPGIGCERCHFLIQAGSLREAAAIWNRRINASVILILEDHIPAKIVDSMTKFHSHKSDGKNVTWLSFEIE